MSISAIPSGARQSSSSKASSIGGMNLKASDFISMMVTQLQNQDPLQPTDSSQLLSQMSQIGQLQSSTQLQTTLTTIMAQSQLASAGNLIGKSVTGMDAQGNTIKGVVNSVSVKSDGVYLKLDTTQELSMSQVTAINATAAASTATTAPPVVGA